jgi:hypothetical protein
MTGAGELPARKYMKYKELKEERKMSKTVWVESYRIYRYLPRHFGTQLYYGGHIFIYHLKS